MLMLLLMHNTRQQGKAALKKWMLFGARKAFVEHLLG
jgi:hypothetical protein